MQEPGPIPTAAASDEDGLPAPRRYWAVAAIWLALVISVLDIAIANIALPTIADDLGASAALSVWVINGYQLAITVALLPFSALGERLGYRKVYIAGLAVFTLGSLACALSQNLAMLIAARAVQGLGAAGIMSLNSAMLRFTYPQRLLGRGIARNAVVISISGAAGPSVAGAILKVASWEWLFAVNVPIGVAAVILASRALPAVRGSGRRFDWVSAGLNAMTFGALILGAESLARDGVDKASGWAELALGAVAAVVLARRELGRPAPLVPFDLLRIPIFGLSICTSIVSFAAQMLALVSLPFYLQGPLGRSVVESGLLLTPWPLAVAAAAPIAGRLSDRYPAGALGGFGLFLLACGLAALALLSPDASNLDIGWRTALCGAGFGFFQAPNNRAMLLSAPIARSGAAGGMLATARLLGQSMGALAVAIFFHVAGTGATGAALGTAAAIAAAAALVSLTRIRLAPPAR